MDGTGRCALLRICEFRSMQGEVGVASPEPAVGGALGPGDLAAAAADHPLQQVRVRPEYAGTRQ